VRIRLFVFLLAASATAPAQELGTLFHSPKERETLDRIRRGERVEQAVAPLPDPVVTGYVKRSDGKSTVFIDKRAYPARDPRMQNAIGPRIIQRYEPYPLPASPAPVPPGEEATPPAKAAPTKKEPVTPPKGGKAE
jgi:hypothetical protein